MVNHLDFLFFMGLFSKYSSAPLDDNYNWQVYNLLKRPTACVSRVWRGRKGLRCRENSARKLFVKCADSHTSAARCVGRRTLPERELSHMIYRRNSTTPSQRHQTIPTTGPRKPRGKMKMAPMPATPNTIPT